MGLVVYEHRQPLLHTAGFVRAQWSSISNVVLDVLDKELERRGHRFAHYADDAVILVMSRRAGERVMHRVKATPHLDMYSSAVGNRRVRTRAHGGVTGTACEGLPMSI